MGLRSYLQGVQQASATLENLIHPTAPAVSQTAALSGAPLSLGDFDFDEFDSPVDGVEFGSSQNMTIITLSGGRRVVQLHGSEDHPIRWRGLLFGPDATQRARQLKQMERDGKVHALCWGEWDFDVVVREVSLRQRRNTLFDYGLEVVVIDSRNVNDTSAGFGSQANADMATALSSLPAGSTGLAGSIQSAMGMISTIGQSAAVATDFVRTVSDVQTAISSRITAANSTLRQLGSIGRIGGGDIASNLTAAQVALQDVTKLGNTAGYLGKTLSNLSSIGHL